MRDRLFKEDGKFVVLLHEFNVTCSIEPNQPKIQFHLPILLS